MRYRLDIVMSMRMLKSGGNVVINVRMRSKNGSNCGPKKVTQSSSSHSGSHSPEAEARES